MKPNRRTEKTNDSMDLFTLRMLSANSSRGVRNLRSSWPYCHNAFKYQLPDMINVILFRSNSVITWYVSWIWAYICAHEIVHLLPNIYF